MKNATRITAWILGTLLTFGLLAAAPAGPASAGSCSNTSPSAVSPEEYAQLRLGMSMPEVRELVGASGVPMDPMWLSLAVGHMERSWKGGVTMSFERVSGRWFLEWTRANCAGYEN